MNRQFSVLGLLLSILVLAENFTTAFNNVLQIKPMDVEHNYSVMKMKTKFSNKKLINFKGTRNLNVLNSTQLNNIEPVTSFVTSSQNNRFPRQVSNKNNNEDTEYKRYIIDELNLHTEIEQNSKPITRNLNESQERKRCTKKITQNVGSINHLQSQKLLSTNIEDGIEPQLKCRECELIKSNTNQGEPKNNYNSNLQLEQMDDDYYIKILNQLIDKINKSKNVTSTLFKDLPIQTKLENRLAVNDSKYDIQHFNLKDSQNQNIETNDNISNKLKDLSEVTVQENKYILTSPLPVENENLLYSRETIKPSVVSSTSKYESDSSMIDDDFKLKFTAKEYSDQFNKEDVVSSYDKNNESQRKTDNDKNINKLEEINSQKMSSIPNNVPLVNTTQFIAKLKRYPKNDETSIGNNNRENNNMDKITENNNIFSKSSAQMLNQIISRTPLETIPETSSKQIENITKKTPRELTDKIKKNIPKNSKINTASSFGDYNYTNYMTLTEKSPKVLSKLPIRNINKHSSQTPTRNLEKLIENYDVNASKNSPRKLITESDKFTSFNPNTRNVKNIRENNIYKKTISLKDSLHSNNLNPVQLQRPSSLVKTTKNPKIQMTPKNKIVNIYSTKIPTDGNNSNTNIIANKNILKSKISKSAQLIQNPKTFRTTNTTNQLENNENMTTSKLNNAKTKQSSVPSFSDKISKTKYNVVDKPLTLSLKNKNIFNNQSPTDRVSIEKTDIKQNLKFKYDADSNVLLKSYPPEQSQAEDLYDHEHAPYTNDYLEPIIFDESTEKANMLKNNSRFVIQSPISRQSTNRNRKHNKFDVKLSQAVPINRPEQDFNYDTRRNNKVEVNVKKQENQLDLNTSSNIPITTNTLDNNKYDVRNPNHESPNPNKFGLLSQVKIADGVFKIPLVSQTSVDNNGSEYVSEIFIPIEKPDGRHSAISLTKLLTGDFKLFNEPGVENLSVIKPTHEMDSTLSSTRTSTDCESSNITDCQVNPNPLKILQAIKDDKKLSAPVHIIQIINNGQCSNKHNDTNTIKKCVNYDDNRTIHKFRNEGRRLSSIRSQNTPNNNRQLNPKIGNAYKHFDSEILDRFLQVYSPHLV